MILNNQNRVSHSLEVISIDRREKWFSGMTGPIEENQQFIVIYESIARRAEWLHARVTQGHC